MKIKGREVIPVNFNWTLADLYRFMQDRWNPMEYGYFQIGKPTPASIEEYIYLPATRNCLVIAYPRKGKIVFSVADNSNGLMRMTATAIPTHNAIAKVYQSSLSIDRAREFRGPAAEICEIYANHMRDLLKAAGLS